MTDLEIECDDCGKTFETSGIPANKVEQCIYCGGYNVTLIPLE